MSTFRELKVLFWVFIFHPAVFVQQLLTQDGLHTTLNVRAFNLPDTRSQWPLKHFSKKMFDSDLRDRETQVMLDSWALFEEGLNCFVLHSEGCNSNKSPIGL